MYVISYGSDEWRTGQNSLLLLMLLTSSAVNRSSCKQAQDYQRPMSLLLFAQRDWSSLPSFAVSIKYIAFGHTSGWTTSVHQYGCGSWRVFGGGSWEGWLFMGMRCFHHPLHEEKSFLDLWKGIQVFCFSFFLQKKEWGIEWVTACNVLVWDACLCSR